MSHRSAAEVQFRDGKVSGAEGAVGTFPSGQAEAPEAAARPLLGDGSPSGPA